ncbi:DUF4340 domain-containing protein, partial [Treponema porcinum]|uniref:DUF4340 domain-containing protein n=1 Tax=Treponema porcinum TaxID=261392 RepID=UPI0023EF9D96
YADSVVALEISKNDTVLSILQDGGLWTGAVRYTTEQGESSAVFPVDKTVVRRIIQNLQKTVTLYKVSEKLSRENSYGLMQENSVTISYRTNEGVTAKITVGNEDFSRTFRYIQIGEANVIYKTDFEFAELLHAESQFWYDPYVIPRSLLSAPYTDIQKIRITAGGTKKTYVPKGTAADAKLLELRHGAVSTSKEGYSDEPVSVMEIEFGQGEFLTLSFYQRISGGAHEKQEKNLGSENALSDYIIRCHSKPLDYAFHVSSWTYAKIMETFGL